MRTTQARAPSYEQLRPLRKPEDVTTPTFPVHGDLADKLVAAKTHPDQVVAHVLATCAGYAYADADTVAMIMARLGLDQNRCLAIAETVDAMFIRSTAFLVQSKCGRVVILCYRGTEPGNFINWLTDADVDPEMVAFPFAGAPGPFAVHGGFYRNVRATRYQIATALQRAIKGLSVTGDGEETGRLEALYVTGHSLGAAMAAMLGLMLQTEPVYEPIARYLRAVYSFGQPMIGDPGLAEACQAHPFLRQSVIRYIHGHDVVAALPPTAAGDFAHFGMEYQFRKTGDREKGWQLNEEPTKQVSNLLDLPLAAVAFVAHQLRWFRNIPWQRSLDDHRPQHYITALTPAGVRSEFGD
jgi:hypothetical protein